MDGQGGVWGAESPGEHVEHCRNASKKAMASYGMKGCGQVQEKPRRWNWQDLVLG